MSTLVVVAQSTWPVLQTNFVTPIRLAAPIAEHLCLIVGTRSSSGSGALTSVWTQMGKLLVLLVNQSTPTPWIMLSLLIARFAWPQCKKTVAGSSRAGSGHHSNSACT